MTMTKKKNHNETLKPLKQPLPAWAYTWITLAGLLLGTGLLFLYIFKAPDLVNQGRVRIIFDDNPVSLPIDENGWFSLDIPPGKQEEKQMVTVQKEGFLTFHDYASPGNPTKLIIVLKKKG